MKNPEGGLTLNFYSQVSDASVTFLKTNYLLGMKPTATRRG